jgi:aldehyde dehydrogenase (NAD+)
MLDKKKFYINGEWVSPKKPNDIKVIDPSTEEDCAVISLGGVEDVNDAVSAATKAFETWAFSSKEERLKYLEALYDLYKKRWADMALKKFWEIMLLITIFYMNQKVFVL